MNLDLEQLAKEAYKLKLTDFTPLGLGSIFYAVRNHQSHKKTDWKSYEENYVNMINRLGILTLYNGLQMVGLLAALKFYYEV